MTVEADGVRRDAALRAFGRFDVASRVRSRAGLFDDVLPSLLTELNTLSFVFEDGPHIPEVTLGVFNAVIDRMASGGLLVFDDIHHRKRAMNGRGPKLLPTPRSLPARRSWSERTPGDLRQALTPARRAATAGGVRCSASPRRALYRSRPTRR